MSGPTSRGNVHLRDLATGEPIGTAEGTNVDDAAGDPDTFGSGNKASVSFVDSSAAGGAPGQLFVVHNDDGAGPDSDVAIAQIDEATGDLVQDVPVPGTPHFAGGGATGTGQNGSDVSGSPTLEVDDAGNGVLVFRVGLPIYDATGAITSKIENVHVVPVRNARSRGAVIDTAHQLITPDFQPTSRTSPTLVTLADPTSGGQPTTYIAMGTSEPGSKHYVKTFRLSDLTPGPTSDALAGWGQTVAVPLTAAGIPAGFAGSGMATAPLLIVATGTVSALDGSSIARVYKLRQDGSRLEIVDSVVLPGYPSPALAVAALVGSRAPRDGRIVITTEHNLFVLGADNLNVVAAFSASNLRRGCAPCDTREAPAGGEAGFYTTTPVVAGHTIYVARDDGSQLALDLDTAQPVSTSQFTQAAGNTGSTFTRGQPAVARGHAVFASANGVFAYRLGQDAPGPPPPTPPGPPAPLPPVAPPPPPPPGGPGLPHGTSLVLHAPGRARLATLRRHGLLARVRLTPARRCACKVNVRLERPAASRTGRPRLIAQVRRALPANGTRVVIRLGSSLRVGRLVLEVTVTEGGRRVVPVRRRALRIVW